MHMEKLPHLADLLPEEVVEADQQVKHGYGLQVHRYRRRQMFSSV